LPISGKRNNGDAAWSRGVHKQQPKEVVMFTAKVSGKSKSATLKIVGAMLALMFVVVLGPGQALAHDDRDDHDRGGDRWHHRAGACEQTSKAALTACQFAAQEEYSLALGRCKNVSKDEQDECIAEAKEGDDESEGFYSALEECDDQYDARQEVCAELGGGPYNPNIESSEFKKHPSTSDKQNSYSPLTKATYTYRSYQGKMAIEEDVVEVTDEIREISGVNCVVVSDIVSEITEDGEQQVTEDTTDWYALDKDRNVWYFGEISKQLEDGILVGIDGSWTTDSEGAKPGYIMLANPKEGDVYRQEFALSEAEDMGRVVGVNEKINDLPVDQWVKDQLIAVTGTGISGNSEVLLHTQDFSALEPESVLDEGYEDKYYAPGIGVVLVIAPDGIIEVLEKIE